MYGHLFGSVLLVLFLLLLVIATAVQSRKTLGRLKLDDEKEPQIPRFSVDASWDPYPTTMDVSNEYDCDASSLRVCKLDDPTTLFGCKELTVRCQHFSQDTDYLVYGKRYTIPRNQRPDEGYALAITHLSDACNPYHGDLVLVSINADATEYMMICECKNPGFIGNEHLLGACDTPFICKGRVVDVNRPLGQVECKCGELEHSVRYDNGLPVCKTMLVKEANERYDDWSHLVPWSSDRLIAKSVFNPTVVDNLRTSRLLDPCANSLHDPSVAIPNGYYNDRTRSCHFQNFGLPVQTGLLAGPKKDPKPTDTSLVPIDAGLSTGPFRYIRVSDNIAGKRKLVGIRAKLRAVESMPEFEDDVLVQAPEGTGVGLSAQVSISTAQKVIAPRCFGNWPTYNCSTQQYYHYTKQNVPVPGHRPCPNEFLWGQESWNNAEGLFDNSVHVEVNGVWLDQRELGKVPLLRPYGLMLRTENDTIVNRSNGFLSFESDADYQTHRHVVT